MRSTSRVCFSSACCRIPCTACDPCSAFLCTEVMYLLVPRSTVCRWPNYRTFFACFALAVVKTSFCSQSAVRRLCSQSVLQCLVSFLIKPLNTGVKIKVKVLLLPRPFPSPMSERELLFGRFLGFARLSFWEEPFQDEYGAMVGCN